MSRLSILVVLLMVGFAGVSQAVGVRLGVMQQSVRCRCICIQYVLYVGCRSPGAGLDRGSRSHEWGVSFHLWNQRYGLQPKW